MENELIFDLIRYISSVSPDLTEEEQSLKRRLENEVGKLSNDYILVEFPEDSGRFDNDDIGYPCFNSEDNGARYVHEYDYRNHFGKCPTPGSRFKILRWPESQNYLYNANDRCEVIMADEKSLAEFGSSAIWVPVEVLNEKGSTPAQKLKQLSDASKATKTEFLDTMYRCVYATPDQELYGEMSYLTCDEDRDKCCIVGFEVDGDVLNAVLEYEFSDESRRVPACSLSIEDTVPAMLSMLEI